MSKYSPLEKFLAGIPLSQREITLSFAQIEKIIDSQLPKSAYQHRAWWSNEKDGNHVEAQSWLIAGWRVETVNQSECWVRLTRKN